MVNDMPPFGATAPRTKRPSLRPEFRGGNSGGHASSTKNRAIRQCLLQLAHARIGHDRSGQIERHESSQRLETCQAGVRDVGSLQIQLFEFEQGANAFETW